MNRVERPKVFVSTFQTDLPFNTLVQLRVQILSLLSFPQIHVTELIYDRM